MKSNDKSSIRFVAVGDVSMNGRYRVLLDRKGAGYPLARLKSRWSRFDLRFGNLESPITKGSRFSPSKCTLRAAEQTPDFLKQADFSAVSLANNHIMDYGLEGLLDTCGHLDQAEINHVGAGLDARLAGKPLLLDCKGQKIALLSYCDVAQTSPLYAGAFNGGVNQLDAEKCCQEIQQLRAKVDWIIVNLHWGVEMTLIPSPQQRELARQLVAAGADVILGHHPHVLQPMETIDGKPVFYSLGNFLFSDMYWKGQSSNGQRFASRLRLHPLSRQTGWAEIRLDPNHQIRARLIPARLRRDLSIEMDKRKSRIRQIKLAIGSDVVA